MNPVKRKASYNSIATEKLRGLCVALRHDMNNFMSADNEKLAGDRQAYVEHTTRALKLHLDNGADPNAYIGMDRSLAIEKAPLHFMVSWLFHDAVKLLIDAGADIYKRDNYNRTPLAMALKAEILGRDAERRTYEMVDILLKAGADPNELTAGEFSRGEGMAISFAVTYQRYSVISLLLDRGARPDVEYPGYKGIYQGYPSSILVEALAPISDLKVRKKAQVCLDKILAHMAPASRTVAIGKSLNKAIAHRVSDLAEHLIQKHGAQINGWSLEEKSPLAIAAGMGWTEMMQFLINAGADVNYRGWRGKTALQEAAEAGQAEAIKVLVANDADLSMPCIMNERQEEGTLAEFCSKKIKDHQMKSMIRALLAKNKLAMMAESLSRNIGRPGKVVPQ